MALEKLPLAASPGMGSIGLERVVNLGSYETYRVGYVKSFALAQEDPDKVYAEVKAKVDGWAAEIRFTKSETQKLVEGALPAPSGKLAQLQDAVKPWLNRLDITEAPGAFYVKTRGYMKPEEWKECNVVIRAQGGKWVGTREGLPGKETHWEIPK